MTNEVKEATFHGSQLLMAEPLLKAAPAKPGWKTSEFYVTVFTQVVTLLVLLDYLGPEAKDTVPTFVSEYIMHATALIASTITAFKYIASRTKAKADAPQFVEED